MTSYVAYSHRDKMPPRAEHDEYITKESDIDMAMGCLKNHYVHRSTDRWGLRGDGKDTGPTKALDYGAGDGRWGVALKKIWPEVELWGIEIQAYEPHPAYDHWIHGDIWHPEPDAVKMGGFDLIFGNPPFKNIDRAIPLLTKMLNSDTARLFLLLKSLYRHGERRFHGTQSYPSLWENHTPDMVFSVAQRLNYVGRGDQGMYDFGFWVWVFLNNINTALPYTWTEQLISSRDQL